MITEAEIRKLIDSVALCNSFRELDLLQVNILNKIQLATSIGSKTKSELRRLLFVAVAKRTASVGSRYSALVSQFYNKMSNRINGIIIPFGSSKITLDQIEIEVLGPITELTGWERFLFASSSSVANKVLNDIKTIRNKLDAQIKSKRAEIKRVEEKKRKERKVEDARRRAEEKRKRKEEEEKKKKEAMRMAMAKKKRAARGRRWP